MDLVYGSVPAFDDKHAPDPCVDFCPGSGFENPCSPAATLRGDGVDHNFRVCLVDKGDRNLEPPAVRVRMNGRREG